MREVDLVGVEDVFVFVQTKFFEPSIHKDDCPKCQFRVHVSLAVDEVGHIALEELFVRYRFLKK